MDAWDEGSSFFSEVEGASRVLSAEALIVQYEGVLSGVKLAKGHRARVVEEVLSGVVGDLRR